jgi:hypothetical protein
MYKVTIADVAELTEEVLKVEFISAIPSNSNARSSSIEVTIIITGRVAYDSDKPFMKDSTKEIATWSMVKPDSADTYKTVSVEFDHTGTTRTYELSHAFVVSYDEQFEDQNGFFTLIVRQKKDRLDGVSVA